MEELREEVGVKDNFRTKLANEGRGCAHSVGEKEKRTTAIQMG